MNNFLLFVLVLLVVFPILLYFIQKCNLEYYKIHGRTPHEISHWLKTRAWYVDFTDNILNEIYNLYSDEELDQEMKDICSGNRDKRTISSAFTWSSTPEGSDYWAEREHKFLAWYFGQYIDFHLTR